MLGAIISLLIFVPWYLQRHHYQVLQLLDLGFRLMHHCCKQLRALDAFWPGAVMEILRKVGLVFVFHLLMITLAVELSTRHSYIVLQPFCSFLHVCIGL